MPVNRSLRLHVINVGHGDAALVEFPDRGGLPRFGLVDAGGRAQDTPKEKTLEYIRAWLRWRNGDREAKGLFEFICLTHPHHDHYSGMLPVLQWAHAKKDHLGFETLAPRDFWDCGFRYNSGGYLEILDFLYHARDDIRFMRVASGAEYLFGDVEVAVLAPSVDLRNRYDSYGVDVNDGSVVLRLRKGKGTAILAGDAHFDSWGKISEEFPRSTHLTYPKSKNKKGVEVRDMRDPDHPDLVLESKMNQLGCGLLKVAHHGSKRGTSFEYLEKMEAGHYAVTCAPGKNYSGNWRGKFPHPLTRMAIEETYKPLPPGAQDIPDLANRAKVGMSSLHGTMVYTISASGRIRRADLGEKPDQLVTEAMLDAAL